jgi:hypothetical protein
VCALLSPWARTLTLWQAHLEGQLLLDPSSHEERQAEALLSVAMTSAGNQVTQLTANGAWPPARLLQVRRLPSAVTNYGMGFQLPVLIGVEAC